MSLRPEEGWDGVSWVKKNMREEKMAVGLHWANTMRQSFHTYHTFHPPIPGAHSSQPKSEDHFLYLFTFPPFFLILLSHFSVSMCPSLPFSILLSSVHYLLTILLSLFFSLPLTLCFNIVSMKTNVCPRIHDIYFPAAVNLPPYNEDRSSFKSRER